MMRHTLTSSIRRLLFTYLTLLCAVIIASLVGFEYKTSKDKLIQSVMERYALNLSELQHNLEFAFVQREEGYAEHLITEQGVNSALTYLFLTDEQGLILYATKMGWKNQPVQNILNAPQAKKVVNRLKSRSQKHHLLYLPTQQKIEGYAHINFAPSAHQLRDTKQGMLHFEYDLSIELNALLHHVLLQQGLLAVELIALFSLLFALLHKWVVRPLRQLQNTSKKMSQGHYQTPIAPFKLQELEAIRRAMHALGQHIQNQIAQLQYSEQQFRTLLDMTHEGIWLLGPQGETRVSNQALHQMLHTDEATLTHKKPLDYVAEESLGLWEIQLESQLACHYQVTLINQLGDRRYCDIYQQPIHTEAEAFTLLTLLDITERHEAEQEVHLLARTFESDQGILITDAQNRIIRVNEAFTQITGYSEEEIIGMTPRILKSYNHDATFYQQMWQSLQKNDYWVGEIWNRRKNGECFPMWESISAIRNTQTQITHYVAIFSDITNKKQIEHQLEQLANFDPLTNLPNRRNFFKTLQDNLERCQNNHSYASLLFIDLDLFKNINDSFGHFVGDQLLVQLTKRFEMILPNYCFCSRIDSDEFVIIVNHDDNSLLSARKTAEQYAESIQEAIQAPYHIQDMVLQITACIGISLFPTQEANTTEHILQHADIALGYAKHHRGSIRFFDQQMTQAITERMAIETGIKKALQQGNFRVFYQPQYNHLGQIIGAEALLRWPLRLTPLRTPDQFIPVAEKIGLIHQLEQHVLEQVCRDLTTWNHQGLPTSFERIAINLSPQRFQNHQLAQQIIETCAQFKIPLTQIELEITESLLIDNFEETLSTLTQLKQLGATFAMDDFGTGYSSLRYLQKLPLQRLKIDKSFIDDMLTDAHDSTLVNTIISLGQQYKLEILAEGVETEEQRAYLEQQGCLLYQGYLWSPAVSASDFAQLLWPNQPSLNT